MADIVMELERIWPGSEWEDNGLNGAQYGYDGPDANERMFTEYGKNLDDCGYILIDGQGVTSFDFVPETIIHAINEALGFPPAEYTEWMLRIDLSEAA